jgi:hypothetical protein
MTRITKIDPPILFGWQRYGSATRGQMPRRFASRKEGFADLIIAFNCHLILRRELRF